jgi:hypothetical protein
MGLPLGGIGAGNDGHEKLVSWSGAVSWGEQELNETEHYPLVRVTEQGMPTANLSCSPWHGRQRCSKDSPMDEAYAGGWRANKTRANMYGWCRSPSAARRSSSGRVPKRSRSATSAEQARWRRVRTHASL